MPLVIILGVIIVVGIVIFFFVLPMESTNETTINEQVRPVQEEQGNTQTSLPTLSSSYQDGSYIARARYFTPKRVEHEIRVNIDIENDTVSNVNVSYDGEEASTPSHLRFDGAYKKAIVGVKVDNLNLSRLGGASLTTDAFNQALGDIKRESSLYDTN